MDADFAIVGSGFGGSVAALRLAEKGYRVVVLEQGQGGACPDFRVTAFELQAGSRPSK
jgi:cholesterol oxidase